MAATISSFTLNDGTKMPSVGMGCGMGYLDCGPAAEKMCKTALKVGYRHFDTAYGYGNEEAVGKAIRESGIPRNEIFLTTKLPNHQHGDIQKSLDESLNRLGCEYIDLYLIHWPQATLEDGTVLSPEEHPTVVDTWKEMERLVGTGKVKTIGVSNFSVKTLTQILADCTIIPAVNQVELHPCLPQDDLKAFCDGKGILLTAYSPLGQTKHVFFEDPDIKAIAERLGGTPAQVVLSWGVQRGTVVIPKSEKEQRMISNITLLSLSGRDMENLNMFHKKPGMHRSLLTYHSEDGKMFGWNYEWLGWNMTTGGKYHDISQSYNDSML